MAVFIDSHVYANVPRDAFLRALESAERKMPNALGARALDLLFASPLLWCVIDAPDESAVIQLHADVGLTPSRLIRVEGLEGESPLSEHDRELILSAIGYRGHPVKVSSGS